jgi:hypothetical protein
MVHSAVWGWLPDQSVMRLSPHRDGFWYQACVHPDGEHAVFWGGGVSEVPRIWRADIERPVPEPLTPATFAARHPAYGLAGDRIAFACDRASEQPPTTIEAETSRGLPPAGRRWNIFTMADDGTDVRQVTDGDHVDQRPSLSPDGSMVAFVSDRGPGIWVASADGSGELACVGRGDIVYRPWWAITGNEIFCFRISQERHQVGRISLHDGYWRPLLNDTHGNTHGPYADPRGDRVLAHSDRDGKFGLWEIPLDGTAMVKLVPPEHENGVVLHGTRARTGHVTFDVPGPD